MYVMPPSSPKPRSAFLQKFKQKIEQVGNPNQGRESSYAVGNRVYNGFSNSPHSGGGLDKTGYQDRDQQAKVLKRNSLQKYINR